MCGFSHLAPVAIPVWKGYDEIYGYKTAVIQTEQASLYRNTVWKAPALDCQTLKMVEDRLDAASQVIGHFELQASKITLGPPDPRLFTIPEEYPERTPMEIEIARRKTLGLPDLTGHMLERLQQMDKEYWENHRATGH